MWRPLSPLAIYAADAGHTVPDRDGPPWVESAPGDAVSQVPGPSRDYVRGQEIEGQGCHRGQDKEARSRAWPPVSLEASQQDTIERDRLKADGTEAPDFSKCRLRQQTPSCGQEAIGTPPPARQRGEQLRHRPAPGTDLDVLVSRLAPQRFLQTRVSLGDLTKKPVASCIAGRSVGVMLEGQSFVDAVHLLGRGTRPQSQDVVAFRQVHGACLCPLAER